MIEIFTQRETATHLSGGEKKTLAKVERLWAAKAWLIDHANEMAKSFGDVELFDFEVDQDNVNCADCAIGWAGKDGANPVFELYVIQPEKQ